MLTAATQPASTSGGGSPATWQSKRWRIKLSSNHALEAQFKIGEFEFVAARGNNPTEFEQALAAIPAALGLIREVQAELGHPATPSEAAVVAQLGGGTAVPSGWNTPAAPNGYPTPPQQAPAVQQAGVPSPSCIHGPMQFRQAKPGSGKTWKGYFCPTPKDTPGQCAPQFSN